MRERERTGRAVSERWVKREGSWKGTAVTSKGQGEGGAGTSGWGGEEDGWDGGMRARVCITTTKLDAAAASASANQR